MQQRIEESRLGRIGISAIIAVTLGALVLINLPESRLREEGLRAAEPYANAIGLDQTWNVFAPDPRRESIRVEARVISRNGAAVVWRPPLRGEVLGAYRDYRWRKWIENVVQDSRRLLWSPAARFVARETRKPGDDPRKVTLVRLWQPLRPPGTSPDRKRWRRYDYYHLTFPRGSR